MSTGSSRPRSRRGDPRPSQHAAAGITEAQLSRLRQWILRTYNMHGPMPDFQLEDHLASVQNLASEAGIRGRRNELARDGFVRRTGAVVLNIRRSPCDVWEFTPPEQRVEARLNYYRHHVDVLADRISALQAQLAEEYEIIEILERT